MDNFLESDENAKEFLSKVQESSRFDYDDMSTWKYLKWDDSEQVGQIVGYSHGRATTKEKWVKSELKQRRKGTQEKDLYTRSEVWWKHLNVRIAIMELESIEDFEEGLTANWTEKDTGLAWHTFKVFPLTEKEAYDMLK